MRNLFERFKNNKTVILAVLVLLVVSASVFALVFGTSLAALNEDYSVSNPVYGKDIKATMSVLKKKTATTFFYTVNYNVTNLDPSVSYIMYTVKSSAYATPINATEKQTIKVGNNVLSNTELLGNNIKTYYLTIQFYDASNNLLDLSTLTQAGTVSIDITEVPIQITTFKSQRWEAPATGTYTIELWGSEGNWYPDKNHERTGRGAYVKGTITLKKGDILQIYTGENKTKNGSYSMASFNGGSTSMPFHGNHMMSSGGGATDIRYFGNTTPDDLSWDSALGLRSRIMVAGAGGGTLQQYRVPEDFMQIGPGGDAGGLKGYNSVSEYCVISTNSTCRADNPYFTPDMTFGANLVQTGGSQVKGGQGGGICKSTVSSGAFGKGGDGGLQKAVDNPEQCQQIIESVGISHEVYSLALVNETNIGGGGGGGYYGGGGGGSVNDCHNGGAGGSSFISGYQGSVAVDASGNPICTEAQAKTDPSCSVHYSGKTFTNTEMIDGKGMVWDNEKPVSQKAMPNPNGGDYPLGKGHNNTGAARITLDVDNTEGEDIAAKVSLVKYEKTVSGQTTTNPMANVIFGLYVDEGGDRGTLVEKYTTDANGRIEITNLAIGRSYYLKEMTAVPGYNIDSTEHKFTTGIEEITLTSYNQRKPGSLQLIKTDDNMGRRLQGAIFELYLGNTLVGTYTTNASGIINVNNLDWGNYTLKETQAPESYEKAPDKTFTINASHLSINLTIEDPEKKGSVTLIKYNEDQTITLAGARFNLYKSDGTLYQSNITTNSTGKVTVNNLSWGSYYFQEITPPSGYSLTPEKIVFSVSNAHIDIVQEVAAFDPIAMKEIEITKSLKIADIVFAHGEPNFVFQITRTDGTRTYYKEIKITEKDLENYLKTNPNATYITKTVKFVLPTSTYDVVELDTVRYDFEKIDNVENGTISGEKVTFNLTTNNGKATFTNKKIDQEDTNHSTSIVNVIKRNIKLTYLTVDYSGPNQFYAGTSLNDYKDDPGVIVVTAYYDDGSVEVLAPNQYDLDHATAEGIQATIPGTQSGSFTIYAVHSSGGITKRAGFNVSVISYTSLAASYSGGTLVPGDNINTGAIALTATYSNSTTKAVNLNSCLSAGSCTISATSVPANIQTTPLTVTITYVEYGVSHSATINIPLNLYKDLVFFENGQYMNGLLAPADGSWSYDANSLPDGGYVDTGNGWRAYDCGSGVPTHTIRKNDGGRLFLDTDQGACFSSNEINLEGKGIKTIRATYSCTDHYNDSSSNMNLRVTRNNRENTNWGTELGDNSTSGIVRNIPVTDTRIHIGFGMANTKCYISKVEGLVN